MILKQLSCVQNVRGTMSVYLVAVGREGEEEHEEDEAGGGDEPQLQHGVGADEEDHGGEHELAPQVDGLPVVELVLVGVGEQRDARALHALGRGVLARGLPHLVGVGVGLGRGWDLGWG